MRHFARVAVAIALLAAVSLSAQGIRERIRERARGMTVSRDQAVDLTLTVTPVSVRPIQVWVRTAGVVTTNPKILEAVVSAADAPFITVGQRVRAFALESRSSMNQARVTQVTPTRRGARVRITLNAEGHAGVRRYVAEIVTDRGDRLSVPNEAIIEEGGRRLVYVQRQENQYEPVTVTGGLQGELFTEVMSGVRDGDQVVTFGSFFIDSEFKLKGTAQPQ